MDSSVLKNDLDMASDKPLYEQLISFIKSDIDDGLLNVGDLLPSENEFCERYDISRPTVRQALSALEEQGLVVRMRGKGSFVTRPKVKRSLKTLYSFSDEVAAMGLKSKSRVIAYEVISPGDEMSKAPPCCQCHSSPSTPNSGFSGLPSTSTWKRPGACQSPGHQSRVRTHTCHAPDRGILTTVLALATGLPIPWASR